MSTATDDHECDLCGQSFDSEEDLREHQAEEHAAGS